VIAEATVAVINADPMLRRWGRQLTADVLLQVGPDICRILIRDGQIASVSPGAAAIQAWTLAFRAEPQAWAKFMSREPVPGFHDVMALVRRGALRIEGDIRPFMQHIIWFKGLFATMRETGA
jgi:hypothetical protein